MRRFSLLVFLVLLGWDAPAHGTIRVAASCSYADVNATVVASADGDTVQVPSGSCTWATTLQLGTGVNPTAKSISITGAGIGVTTLTSATGTAAGKLIQIVTKNFGSNPAGYFRISGFTFHTGVGCGGSNTTTVVDVSGTSKNVRIDHNRFWVDFSPLGCGGLRYENVLGVIDHNTFTIDTSGQHGVMGMASSWNGVGQFGDNSWASASTWGTTDVMAVENNTFETNIASICFGSDAQNGARQVFRFNIFNDCVLSTHGTESGGRVARGHRHLEAYNNTFNYTRTNIGSFIGFRGGTGFSFNNIAQGSGASSMDRVWGVTTLRENDTWDDHQGAAWGKCGILTVTSLTRSGSTARALVSAETHYIEPAGSGGTGGSWVTVDGADQPEYNVTAFAAAEAVAISSSSVGNPATITTAVPHNWATGQLVRIVSHTGGVPDINSTYTITVTGASTFTIPVNVTTGGTGGEGRNGVRFTYTIPSGTPTTPATGTSITAQSPLDQNADTFGYRCMDQGGAGRGILYSGSSMVTTTPLAPSNNALEPIYVWGETKAGVLDTGGPQAGAQAQDIIKFCRDVYAQTTSFTGACSVGATRAGVGVGSRASRPATCTPFVLWWTTDDGSWDTTLSAGTSGVGDRCDSPNHWTNGWYVPISYPHFLIAVDQAATPPVPSVTATGSNAPAPPTGVRLRGGRRAR